MQKERMRAASVRQTLVVGLFVAVALALPGPAFAGWPLRAPGEVTLGFGSAYEAADGTTSTHRGTDIAAETGSAVLAPATGEVTFVGRVPAASGGTVLAVTLATSKGSLTLLPLDSAGVTRGTELSEGDRVGTLAGTGDASSAGTHLHVGVRKGDLYIDPLGVISAPVAPAPKTAQPTSQHAQATADAHATAQLPKATAPGAAPHVALAPTPSAVPAPAVPALKPAMPGAQLAEGVSVAGVAPLAASGAAAGVGAGAASATARLAETRSPAEQMASDLGRWASSTAGAVAKGHAKAARAAGLGALGILAALGMLWPLWRRDRRKGSVQVGVSAVREDVAAAVGR
jgi:hypothetical protein